MYRAYGYDFRSYARSSLERRIRGYLSSTRCASIAEMIEKVLYDREFFSGLARSFSVSVSEMFRDPFFYKALRNTVVPVLRTWHHVKIWHAGCAAGEEAYSLAILLKEEGVYDRVTIYATDFNDAVLEKAKAGIYSSEKIREATANYQKAGGKASFSDYYHSRYDAAILNESLKERIVFANHNLTADNAFGEMQLILCRNVLIYFNMELKNRALKLFTESLARGGFLCLGARENLQFTGVSNLYDEVDRKASIYKRRVM